MKLKRFCVATSISLFGLLGCGKSEIKKLEAENQMLLDFSMQQDAVINEVAQSINSFEKNLGTIVKKEEWMWKVSRQDSAHNKKQLETISGQLRLVDSLIQKNEELVERLHHQVEKSEGKWNKLQKTVSLFQEKLRQKHQEVTQLRNKLGIAIEHTYTGKEDFWAIRPKHKLYVAGSHRP